jgi:hypothetical protein
MEMRDEARHHFPETRIGTLRDAFERCFGQTFVAWVLHFYLL